MNELVRDGLVHDQSTRARAALPRRDKRRTHNFDRGLLEMRVGHDDRRVVAAQFERDNAARMVEIGLEDLAPDGP